MARVLCPLPDRDFDPTEAAVPWRLLTRAGHEVVFATERGAVPVCDPRMIHGILFGLGGAKKDPKDFYAEMSDSRQLQNPMKWADINPLDFDALVLPGGHAPGMKQYLGSEVLQKKVSAFSQTNRLIGAICHGVLLMSRAVDPVTNRSALHNKRTTCLPKYMERLAYWSTMLFLGRYFKTYDMYVQDEVCRSLGRATQFDRGPLTLGAHGAMFDDDAAFIVEDRNYISARWPGDAFLFAKKLVERLEHPLPVSALESQLPNQFGG